MSESILTRWRRPSQDVLHEERFPSDKPPFDPFPTVTEISNAYFCPLAIYYDLWFNIENALEPPRRGRLYGAGNVFQNFITHIKNIIIKGEEVPDGRVGIYWIRDKYENYSREMDNAIRIWEFYLEDWTKRKIPELMKIQPNENIFFEITVATAYVRFRSEKGVRSYPILGRIDEINIDEKRIIERTIKRGESVSPPLLKDYQLWLLWKTLCSIDKNKYPHQWRNVDFTNFDLVVETPYKDYLVEKDQHEFETLTHDAFANIHDLTFERRGVKEAYDRRRCNYDNKEPDCALPNICYFGKPEYPSSRNEMRREFKRWCRALLHEIMWNRDLRLYQFTMLNEQELKNVGCLVTGKITDQPKINQIEVEIPKSQVGPVSAISSDQLKQLIVVPFGSLELGLRVGARVSEKQTGTDKILLNLVKSVPISNQALIFTEDFLLFQEQPVFLSRLLQRDLFWLERRGKKKLSEALKLSPVQLLEGIFGTKIIKREREST